MTNEVTGPVAGSEVGALLRALDGQRRHVLGALDGLAEEDLRRPVLPSGWHCLGLVRHLTLDVERFWFRAVLAGEEEVIRTLPSGDEAWQVAPETAAADVLDRYQREAELADALITATPAEAPWPGGRTSCSAHRICTPCVTSCCTSSPRRRATPGTSTRPGS